MPDGYRLSQDCSVSTPAQRGTVGSLRQPAGPATDPDRWYALEELTGTKVALVPLAVQHADGFLAALGTGEAAAEVYRHLGRPAPGTTAEVRTELRGALAARARGERLPYAQFDRFSGSFIGTTSFYEVSPGSRSLAIGHTWLGRDWWRSGFNIDSKLTLLTHAFETLGAARVVWHTDLLNERSQRAIEALGATREGVLRKHRIRTNGTWRDTVQYAMTDEDWPASREHLTARLNRVP
jgi:N-acetyltransferase